MDTNARVEMEERLRRSAERLVKFLDLHAPASIICDEVAITFQATIALYGGVAGEALGTMLARPLRQWYGRCQECLQPIHKKGAALCALCAFQDEMVTYQENDGDDSGERRERSDG